MKKNLEMGFIYNFYNKLLTDKQNECLNLYYNEDMSLSEIAAALSITKQAVHDNIHRAEKALLNYENKLGLIGQFLMINADLLKIKEYLQNNHDKDEIIKEIDNLLNKLED